MTKFILDTGAVDINSFFTTSEGENLVTLAARYGHLPIVKHLLPSIHNSDSFRQGGQPAFTAAVTGNHLAVAQFLLDPGLINPNAKNYKGLTAFMCAVSRDITEDDMVRFLLASPAVNPNMADAGGIPPILAALHARNDSIAKLLMRSGRVDVQVNEIFGLACQYSLAGAMRQLLSVNEIRNTTRDELGSSWLHIAAELGEVDAVKILMNRSDIPIDEQRNDGRTALMCSVANKGRAAATALLKAVRTLILCATEGQQCYIMQPGTQTWR
jgi:serine/threonine-protein phosphatase 6 regulatory ankyrin repeat subunit B